MKFFFQSSESISLNPKRLIQLGSQVDEENNQISDLRGGLNRWEKRIVTGKIRFFLGVIYFISLAVSLFLLLS